MFDGSCDRNDKCGLSIFRMMAGLGGGGATIFLVPFVAAATFEYELAANSIIRMTNTEPKCLELSAHRTKDLMHDIRHILRVICNWHHIKIEVDHTQPDLTNIKTHNLFDLS